MLGLSVSPLGAMRRTLGQGQTHDQGGLGLRGNAGMWSAVASPLKADGRMSVYVARSISQFRRGGRRLRAFCL